MKVVAKKNKFKKKFKKWKANINIIKLCQKNKSKVMGQHGHSLNTWQISWKVTPKEKVHLKRFDQCTKKNYWKRWPYNVENSNNHIYLSNENRVRDVPLPFLETFITTKEGYTYLSFYLNKCFLQFFQVVWKITFYKCSLTENANCLVKAMNKFANFL